MKQLSKLTYMKNKRQDKKSIEWDRRENFEGEKIIATSDKPHNDIEMSHLNHFKSSLSPTRRNASTRSKITTVEKPDVKTKS